MNIDLIESKLPSFWKLRVDENVNTQGHRYLYIYEECSSTQDSARSYINKVDQGFERLILTRHQTQGYGRRGRSWFAPKGSALTFTLITSRCSTLSPGLVGLFSGLCMYDSVAQEFSGSQDILDLKWPNDLLLHQKKCGGLLVESVEEQGQGVMLIGCGINIGPMDFPEALQAQATSISEVNQEIALEEVFTNWIHVFENRVKRIQDLGPESIIEDFAQRSTWVEGKEITFEDHGQQRRGRSAGLSEGGNLICDLSSGERIEVSVSEISSVRKSE